jgi:hypothetical protein
MASVIVKNPKILGGTPVFRGTRVPLQLLFNSLERGHTLEGGIPHRFARAGHRRARRSTAALIG